MRTPTARKPPRRSNGRKSSGRCTIGEIARVCGLSKSTISRVLNDQLDVFKIHRDTVDQIRKTAADLGYRPNRLARAIASGRTHLIALSLPFVPHHTKPHDYFLSPVIRDQLTGIFSEPRFDGYDLVIHKRVAGEEIDARGGLLDGMLFVDPEGISNNRLMELAGQLPVVVIGSSGPRSRLTFVDVDNAALVKQAIRMIDAGGHRLAGYLDSQLLGNFRCMKIRRKAFVRKAPGVRVVALSSDPVGMHRDLAAMRLKSRRDALIVAEETTGYLAAQCLRNLGFRVPGDILLVTIGGEQPALAESAGLVVVSIPFERMAQTAAGILLDHLENGKPLRGESVKVPFSAPDSTARIP